LLVVDCDRPASERQVGRGDVDGIRRGYIVYRNIAASERQVGQVNDDEIIERTVAKFNIPLTRQRTALGAPSPRPAAALLIWIGPLRVWRQWRLILNVGLAGLRTAPRAP